MHVVILAALLPEARAIARAFHLPLRFAHRQVRGESVSIYLIGPAARYLSEVAALKPQALIMAGLAGAVAPELRVGDLVIQGAHPPLKSSGPTIHDGAFATVSKIVATPAEKAALFRATGALAVDMETLPAQQLAASLGIPFLALRAISDSAADTLDPALLTLVDPEGRPRIGRAMAHLARHPAKLSALLRIRDASNLALVNLATALVGLLESGWPNQP